MSRSLRVLAACAAFGLIVAASAPAAKAQTFTTLYHFCSQTDCSDGEIPYAGLIQGSDGNFYGTTSGGGANRGGTAFKITPSGTLTTLYSFCAQSGCTDGDDPFGGLTEGSDGNFYGTTSFGGASDDGEVFELTPSGALTTLYSFCAQSDCTDGEIPRAGLVQGSDGNFYGTTNSGGADGLGTVFKLTPSGTLTTLFSFCPQTRCTDGYLPVAGLIQASDGNFYGTMEMGGANDYGTVYKITPTGTLTTLYSFCAQSGCADGSLPYGAPIQGSDGNFYGTTGLGGANDYGTVFKLTPSGALTTLYSFCAQSDCTDGWGPHEAPIQASDGNFYGTTYYGGANGGGTAFKLTPAGALTTLYSFCAQLGCSDGEYPYAGLVQGSDGNFYGTNLGSGFEDNQGTVFKLAIPAPAVTFSPNSLAFGSVAENSSSTLDLTITNSGTASLDITNFSISAGSPTFAIVSGGTCDFNGQTLTAGGSCTVALTFSPTTSGPLGGTLAVTDNAGGSPQSVSLTGTGTVAVAALSPSSLDFGNVSTVSTSASQPVTLSNTGTAALGISSIVISANFGQTNNCNGSVTAGSSCTINVTFAPTATGVLTGTLTITDNSNGVANSAQTVSLSGTGIVLTINWPGPIVVPPPPSQPVPLPGSPAEPVAPRSGGGSPIAIGPGRPILSPLTPASTQSGGTAVAPIARFSSSSLVFSAQAVGTSSSTQTVTLSNPGDAAVPVSSITASGDFAQTNNCGNALAAGAICTISVTFKPAAAGPSTGTLSISEEPAGSPQSVALRGTGSTVVKPHQGAAP